MTHKELEKQLLSLEDTWLDYPFGEGVAVYKVGEKNAKEGKLFAIIAEGSDPLKISLKCDPALAITLREKYESVMSGYHLNKKHWNTIVCSGQLPEEELTGLILHSYNLVVGKH